MNRRRKVMIDVLRDALVPRLIGMGFRAVPITVNGEVAKELRAAFPFGCFKRRRGDWVDAIELQFDKYERPRFVFNFGRVPPTGVRWPWVQLSQDDTFASDLPDSFRLYSRERSIRWFATGWWPVPPSFQRRAERTAAHAVRLLPEIESWFETGKIGPHVVRTVTPTFHGLDRS